VSWRDWVRTVEIEPSLYAADFSRLGEQIEALLRAGVRIFHFDVGDGHFVPPVTMGPDRAQVDLPTILEHDGAIDCHLMVENPERHFEAIREAGGSSVTFHYEACDDPQAIAGLAREQGSRRRSRVQPRDFAGRRGERRRRVRPRPLHEHPTPGYSGQQSCPRRSRASGRFAGCCPRTAFVQVDGGVGPETSASCTGGASLLVAGTSIFGREDLPRAYRRLVQALA
jgi:ribulose-phosphate 3-epimerase